MAHFAANYVANLIPGALFHTLGEGGLGKKKNWKRGLADNLQEESSFASEVRKKHSRYPLRDVVANAGFEPAKNANMRGEG